MTTPIQIELHCPNCETMFKSTSLMSTNTFGPKTTDFYQQAGGFQPLSLYIHTCPTCGYTGYSDDFENIKIEENVKNLIAERLTPLVRDEIAFPGRRYEYAAWIATWRGISALKIAHLYHRAAWCCYDDGRKEDENYYRRQAIERFEQSLESGEIPAADAAVYTYLIAELYRRVGERENATLWFERVITVAGPNPDKQWIVEIAEQQKTNPKEFFERN